MTAYAHFCRQCGYGFHEQDWKASTFCSKCGGALRQPYQHQTAPQGVVIDADTKSGQMMKRAHSTYQFVKANPSLSAVTATGLGGCGLLLAPMVITAGHAGMVAGGVVVALGALFGDEVPSALKSGLALVAGSTAVTAGGYLMLGASGVAVASGVGAGTVQAIKGVHVLVENRRKVPGVEETKKGMGAAGASGNEKESYDDDNNHGQGSVPIGTGRNDPRGNGAPFGDS